MTRFDRSPASAAMRVALLAASVCASAPAWAGDWYVDAINGHDNNTGTSPASPWRTITHAHATVPAPLPAGEIERIHIAPGVYDVAHGESFPITLLGWHDKRQFIGEAGPANTVLDAGGASAVISLSSYAGFISADTVIAGLSLRNAARGVHCAVGNRSNYAVLRDLDVSGCQTGMSFSMSASNFRLDVLVERVRVHHNLEGLILASTSLQPMASVVRVFDSSFEDQGTFGMFTGGGTHLSLARVQIARNGTHGIMTDDQGFASVQCTIEDSTITDNGANGVELARGLPWTGTTATLRRCTIARNAASGLNAGGAFNSATLASCIVYANGDDLSTAGGGLAATFCDIGDGDFAGTAGNFAADPLFVDADGGDYRLRWASPCVETGDPATPSGALDLARHGRPIDGDLDTLERFDVGAFEFAPLFERGGGQAGTILALELWGPQGAPSVVYWTRQASVPPQPTPFGELELLRSAARVFQAATAGSGPPVTLLRQIPNDPTLIGRTFSFQALTASGAAPLGLALTNASQITIVP